jgi:hypothetical protein
MANQIGTQIKLEHCGDADANLLAGYFEAPCKA